MSSRFQPFNPADSTDEITWLDQRRIQEVDGNDGDAPRNGRGGDDQTAEIPLPMRTILRQFGEAFDDRVAPIIGPVRHAAEVLANAPEELEARQLLPELRDLMHQFQQLADKVAEQQAYVLIFGPLKSGKSTFMNAICAAYVSEVTALPAYPCMVNVTHAAESEFIVTHYDGSTERFADRDALHRAVEQAHQDLTDAMRRHEAEGIAFDPAVHMPAAIRRIELRLPTGDLAESGAVLVDTPGLYSRMKFGYDRMTRDFRNAAACAIFIVKTDNLFLEQVFEEFQELLELFSRIFLVVNLDSSKRDLAPDGTLKPSLEHEDPQRVIRAFEDLAMTAPLKEAAEAGRLSIYPVDLLQAASRRIRSAEDEAASGSAEDTCEDEADEAEGAGQRPHDAEFDRLLTDLTEYLNSNEYLKAFLTDSLRRSQALLGELAQLVSHASVDRLDAHLAQLQRQRQALEGQQAAIDRLSAIDWADHAEALTSAVRSLVHERALQWRQSTRHALTGAIESWFQDDTSLAALDRKGLRGLLDGVRDRFLSLLNEQIKTVLADLPRTLDLPEQMRSDLKAAGVDLTAMARQATDDLAADDALSLPERVLDAKSIPVRRRFWDWLLLRSAGRIRTATLGPDAEPDRAIPAQTKARRLGDPARAAMNTQAHERLEQMLRQASNRFVKRIVDQFIETLSEALATTLAGERSAVTQQLHQRHRQIEQTQKVSDSLTDLGQAAIATATSVQTLQQRFGLEQHSAQDTPLAIGEVPDDPAASDADADGDNGRDTTFHRPQTPMEAEATEVSSGNGDH